MKIGTEYLTFEPESKKAIDIELPLLDMPLFATIVALSFDYITWPLFL